MDKTLLPIRIAFVLICAAAGWLVSATLLAGDERRVLPVMVGFAIGALVVLVDIMLKGFSLRGLSAMTFGLAIGLLVAHMFAISPLLEISSDGTSAAGGLDPKTVYLIRVALFVICPYLATVIAMRCKDEFNLVIPYVRFVPHEVDVPLVVVDARALIDGRIARLCEAGFMSAALVIPRFVQLELQRVAEQPDPTQQARGRRGLEVLNELRKIKNLDIRVTDSEVNKEEHVDAKLLFLAQAMRAKLLTTDYNLAKMAEFNGVAWLDLNQLSKALRPELTVGNAVEVDLVKPGKEDGQAVGFLEDGSMVVVNAAKSYIGKRVQAEIVSVLPTAGGKMVFTRLIGPAD
jgi:uncharacterized protein YacL